MKRSLILVLIRAGILAAMMLLSACGSTVVSSVEIIVGTGNVITSQRDAAGFSSVQVNLGADLELTQAGTESLTIQAEENLQQYIQVRVVDGRLIISTTENTSIAPTRPIRLAVNFDTLDEIEILGESHVTAQDLELDTLRLSFSGAGSTRLTGRVNQQTIVINGQATINNFGLSSDSVQVNISGNGTIEVNAEVSLDLTVAGMGIVRYTGDPEISQTVNGIVDISGA